MHVSFIKQYSEDNEGSKTNFSTQKRDELIDSFVGKKETHFNNLHEAEVLNKT